VLELLKNKGSIYGIVIIFLISSCSSGGGHNGPNYYFKPVIYEYSIGNKTYSKIKDFDVTNVGSDIPWVQYFKDNNKIIFIQNRMVSLIDLKNKRENIVDLDSLLVKDNIFSISPIENIITFSGFNSAISNGLYLLDVDTKRISVIKYNKIINFPELYFFPTFSNNGQLISYAQINYDNLNYSGSDRSLFNINLTTKKDKKIYQSDDYLQFSLFDKTDKNITFLGTHIFRINLDSNEIDTIDNSHYYPVGFPFFLITTSDIYYTCASAITYPQDHQIFVYENESKKSTYLTEGMLPMSENSKNGNLLIRASCNNEDKGSPIEIITPNGEIVEILKTGFRATFSPDGNKVLLLILEDAYVD
jgi:hypothetical protein